jgi:MFS family permease
MTALAEPVVASPWRGRHGRTTLGVFSLSFLFAFEALAVSTVMPDIAADLHGLRWYPVAFAAPLAAAIVALATAGPDADRRGPGPVLRRGLLAFCAGALLAGAAPDMPLFLVGRLVQGYGGGAIAVALYVVIAQAYPERLRPRVFAVLTTAWVLPSLVGPLLAAAVADAVGWRWVFLGVPVLAVAAWLLVAGAPSRAADVARERGRVGPALVAAGGALLVSLAGQRVPGWQALVALGLALVLLGGRRILPAGAWSLGPGLPAVLGARGAIGTAFASAEVYVPLLLVLHRHLTITEAGWVLTTGAVTWTVGAHLAARWSVLSDEPTRVRLGAGLVAAGAATFATVAVPGMPLALPVLGWGVGGLGIGMAFSTLSVLALAVAEPGEEGRVSSALQVNDYLLNGAGLALGGVVFAGFAGSAPVGAATGLVLSAAVLAGLALVPAARLRAA